MSEIIEVADILHQAAETQITVPPVREIIGVTDLDKAYAIQKVNVLRRAEQGDVITGKKIGLTSPAVQKQLGVDQPDYGILFKSMELEDGILPMKDAMQPKAECEVVFRVGEDLDGEVDMERLKDAIEYAVIGIEIAGSRVADWNIRITDTIADNASASHYVLGKEHRNINDLDLVNCKMQMTKDGELVSEGTGADCMGSPLISALWLAQLMSKQGNPLRKGEILLSGALGPMLNVKTGDDISASIEGLGSVQLKIR